MPYDECRLLTLEKGKKDYPATVVASLKSKAPETIYCLGNLELLKKPGVGFCGARNSSLKGIETAKDCASQVGNVGLNVVSGNASGIDLTAHKAALQSGGSTILVLAEGINYFRIRKELKEYWDWQRVLVVSQFHPDATWKTYQAMERNKLIIALSRAMIVIEAGEKGGTFNAGLASLKLGCPLFVALYENMLQQAPGNQKLLELGGVILKKSRSLGYAKLDSIFEIISRTDSNSIAAQKQLSLI